MSAFRRKGLLALAGGLFLLIRAPLAAQEPVTLHGRVADASDAPVAGAVVLLHAIGESAGREIDRDTADASGAFELSFVMEEGPLYFVATRIGGSIFMGDPFRELPGGELVLRAGAGVEPLQLDGRTPGPAMPQPPSARAAGDDGRRAAFWVLLIGAALAGFVGWVVQRGRRRPSRARELMVEIARLDEAYAAAGGARPEPTYRTRRDELRARLAEALELDPDADRH